MHAKLEKAITAATQVGDLVEAGVDEAGSASASIALTLEDVDTGDTPVIDVAQLAANDWVASSDGKSYTYAGTYGTASAPPSAQFGARQAPGSNPSGANPLSSSMPRGRAPTTSGSTRQGRSPSSGRGSGATQRQPPQISAADAPWEGLPPVTPAPAPALGAHRAGWAPGGGRGRRSLRGRG